jgi:hypothetical protein
LFKNIIPNLPLGRISIFWRPTIDFGTISGQKTFVVSDGELSLIEFREEKNQTTLTKDEWDELAQLATIALQLGAAKVFKCYFGQREISL